MDKFIKLADTDKRDAFQEAAKRLGVLPIIIEKDFWVCWTLKQLYTISELSEYITFKGGTSLSKAFGLIERFSEDVDLTISKTAPGLTKSQSPIFYSIFHIENTVVAIRNLIHKCRYMEPR